MHAVAHHSQYAKQGPFIHHHTGKSSAHRHNHHDEYAMVYEDVMEDKIDVIIGQLTEKYPDILNKRWHAIKMLEMDKRGGNIEHFFHGDSSFPYESFKSQIQGSGSEPEPFPFSRLYLQ